LKEKQALNILGAAAINIPCVMTVLVAKRGQAGFSEVEPEIRQRSELVGSGGERVGRPIAQDEGYVWS